MKIPEMELIAEGLDEEAGGEDFETRDLAVHMIDILYHDEAPSEQNHRQDHEHEAQDLELLEDPQNGPLLNLLRRLDLRGSKELLVFLLEDRKGHVGLDLFLVFALS